jgi:hypothetical protein
MQFREIAREPVEELEEVPVNYSGRMVRIGS